MFRRITIPRVSPSVPRATSPTSSAPLAKSDSYLVTTYLGRNSKLSGNWRLRCHPGAQSRSSWPCHGCNAGPEGLQGIPSVNAIRQSTPGLYASTPVSTVRCHSPLNASSVCAAAAFTTESSLSVSLSAGPAVAGTWVNASIISEPAQKISLAT